MPGWAHASVTLATEFRETLSAPRFLRIIRRGTEWPATARFVPGPRARPPFHRSWVGLAGVAFCLQFSIIPCKRGLRILRRAYTGRRAQRHPRSWRSILPATCSPAKHPERDALFSTLYSELHRLARRQLAGQFVPSRLGATTLLHEAYLNMAKGADQSFPDRARFMAYAARVMRGLIIDHARARNSAKKGGRYRITAVTLDNLENPVGARELARINDALEELTLVEPELATLVDLKFFCGFSFAEIGAMQSISERTVQRKWEKARIYLYQSIGGDVRHD
jgi:RNA polymerase sigma factor (TIGR02999 family)